MTDDFDLPDIFFFHGLESGPHGTKYRVLSRHFAVESPDFRGLDIEARLEKAEDLTRNMDDLVVVGSSYGGLLTALLYSRNPERFHGYVLLAPALHLQTEELRVERAPENAVIIHGSRDDVVPMESTSSWMASTFSVPVVVVDDDHRLHDSLDTMIEQVEKVVSGR